MSHVTGSGGGAKRRRENVSHVTDSGGLRGKEKTFHMSQILGYALLCFVFFAMHCLFCFALPCIALHCIAFLCYALHCFALLGFALL